MECINFKSNILDYYYHECDNDTSGEIKKHLAVCPKCSELFGQMSQVLGSTEAIKDVEPAPFYYTRLSSKINERPERNVYSRFFVGLAKPALAACFAVFGIFIGHKIVDSVQEKNIFSSKTEQVEVAELQLADEYFPKADNEEILETYYLNE